MTDARTILLVRPEAQAAAFAAALDARFPGRFRPVPAPVFAIEPLPVTIELDGVQGLAFTSVARRRGVRGAAARDRASGLVRRRGDGGGGARRRLRGGLGGRRRRRARAAGGGRLAARRRRGPAPARRGMRPATSRRACGRPGSRPATSSSTTSRRGRCRRRPGRCSRPAAPTSLAFFSPRGAQLFAAEARAAGWPLGAAAAVSISPATDAGLDGLGLGRRLVAQHPDRPGMLAAIARL